jgi:hypothetical protein
MKLTRVFSLGIAVVALLSECSGPTDAEKLAASERAGMLPLKTTYPDAVMGFDFHDGRVDISIDMNGYIDLGDDGEEAVKSDALKRWRSTWIATHPGQHAALTVRFLDFRGNTEYKATTKA